ncbi:hypothetical protein B0H14DRAFT_3173182, partial [Mycena olivaceomarginata]
MLTPCAGVDCEDPDALEHLLAELVGAKSEFALQDQCREFGGCCRRRKGRERKHVATYRDVVLSLIAAVLAGSGQELRAERLRTEGVAGVDVHGVVVREQRHNGRGCGYREGRMRKDA